MTETAYRDFFENLAQKPIIGHNPTSRLKRFHPYDPDHLIDFSVFDLDITNFCLLLSRPDLSIPYSAGADEINHPTSFLIIRSTDGTQQGIDLAIAQAKTKALSFWAKLREIQEENFFLFEKVSLAKEAFKIENLKGLPDNSAGVDVMFTLSEKINYSSHLNNSDWE